MFKDLRPPTAVAKREGEIGFYYDLMMRRFAVALKHIETHVPSVAQRMPLHGSNWYYSSRANYAGWDITHFDIDGPAAVPALQFECSPVR